MQEPVEETRHDLQTYMNVRLPHPHAQCSNEFFYHGNSKESEENLSIQNQAKLSECSMERVGSSLVGSTVTNNSADKQKSPLNSSSIVPNHKETPLQSQTTEGSDILEDDVKVCDICGDAGREEMLAICSRCSDGAEHTYCMQIMLDKVPEGDWLCEECQLKENAEKTELDKMKTVTETPKESSMKEKDFGGVMNPKLVLKLDSKADEVDANKVSKVTSSSLPSTKRHADTHEDSLKSRKPDTNATAGASEMVSLFKNSALSRGNSLKSMDVGKLKQSNLVASSGSQFVNNSEEIARSLSTVGLDSSRTQENFQPPRGLLSRSATFNCLSSKPKVKLLLEDDLQRKKLAKKPSRVVTRKEGLAAKSMLFKMPSSCHSNTIKSKLKMQSSYLSHAEDPGGLKHEEQSLSERKSSFKLDHAVVSSPAAVTSMSLPKADPESVFPGDSTSTSVKNASDPNTPQSNGKLNPCNSTISFACKGSEKLLASDGRDEVKKQLSCLSSGLRIPISEGMPKSAERKPYQVGPKENEAASFCVADASYASPDVVLQGGLLTFHESTKQDGNTKGSSALNSSNLTSSSTGKNFLCHRCSKAGHTAQFCIASNHVSALKASAASSGEICNKSSKWKDAVEAISTARYKEHDQSGKLFMSSTILNGEIASKDQLSSSPSFVTNLSSIEVISDSQEALQSSLSDSSRTTATINVKQHPVRSTETLCAPRETKSNSISTNSDELKLIPCMMKMSTQASVAANILRISAIPVHDYIWQGGFMLQRRGKLTDHFDGIQAHMSTCASPRVLELVKKFPCKVELEEIPRPSSWPMQFQGKATEDNIALYFFAKDLESYESNYKRLLDNMVNNDLALKGHVDRIELLIFPSNLLPEKSQYWNRLFFLWAVFRERRETCLESLSHSPKNIYGASLGLESSIQAPVVADVVASCLESLSHSPKNIYGASLGLESSIQAPVVADVVASCLESLSHSPKNIYGASLGLESSIQAPVVADVVTSQRTGLFGQKEKEVSMYDNSPKAPEAIKSNTVDLPFLSSFQNGDKNCYRKASSLDQRPINFHEHNQLAINDTRASEKQAFCSIAEIHPSTSVIQLTRVHDGCSLSSIPVTNPELFPEVRGDNTSLEDVDKNFRSKKETQLHPCVQPTIVQNSFNKDTLATLNPDNSHCRLAGLTSNTENSQDTSSFTCQMLPVSSSSLPEKADSGERLRLMDTVTLLEANRWKEPIGEQSSWELGSSRKRPHSKLPDAILETSGVSSKEATQTMAWKEKKCLQVDGGNSFKKMKRCNDLNVRSVSHEQTFQNGFLPKILGLDPNSLHKEQKDVYAYNDTSVLENSKTTEIYLFPVDSGNARDLKSGNSIPWQILPSDENLPDTDVPNLELALGAGKKQSKQGSLPLFGQLRAEDNNRNNLLNRATSDGDDDLSASLSLSLSFPFSEKEQPRKSVSKVEHLLPKRHRVNTSLLLFGGFTDS